MSALSSMLALSILITALAHLLCAAWMPAPMHACSIHIDHCTSTVAQCTLILMTALARLLCSLDAALSSTLALSILMTALARLLCVAWMPAPMHPYSINIDHCTSTLPLCTWIWMTALARLLYMHLDIDHCTSTLALCTWILMTALARLLCSSDACSE